MQDLYAEPFEGGSTCHATDAAKDEEMLRRYMEAMEYSVRRQYAPTTLPAKDDNARRGVLRCSSLGKPAILQLLSLTHIQAQLETAGIAVVEDEPDERRQLMFHLGDWFESWFEYFLHRQGMEIWEPLDGQQQWTFNFHGVEGHGDIVAANTETNKLYLIECKCMGSYLVKAMVKDPWSQKPEYVTQASVYAECLQEMYPEWEVIPIIAALSLDERRVYYIQIDTELQALATARAAKLIEVIPTIESFEASCGVIKAPPGERIIYYNKPISNYLTLPPSMKYVPMELLELFYHVREESIKTGRYNKKVLVIGEVNEEGQEVTWYRKPSL